MRRYLALLSSLLFIFAACGDGETDTPSTSTTTATTQAAATTAPATTSTAPEATTEESAATTAPPTSTTSTTLDPPATGPTGTVTVAIPTFGNELLDPTRSSNPDLPYWGNSFDFLMGMDENGNPTTENGAARAVESSPDAKVWTIELREGMTFHDGVEVTAEDVAFSFELYASEGSACTSCGKMQNNFDSAVVTGDYSLEVTFKEPNALFLRDLTRVNDTLAIIPKHHWEAMGGADGFNENPLGSGPYVFSDRAIGEFVEFNANTEYWNPDRIPGFETLRIVLAPEATSRLALLERGDADLALMDPFTAPDVLAAGLEIAGPKRVQTLSMAFGMPWKTEFFYHNQAAREALIKAVDVAAIVSAIYPEGTAVPAASFAAVPSQEGHDPSLTPYAYDPGAAAQEIQDLGLVGQEITMYQYAFGATPEFPRIQEAVAAFWTIAGLSPQLRPTDFATIRPNFLEAPYFTEPFTHLWFVTAGTTTENALRIGVISKDVGGFYAAFGDPALDDIYGQYRSEVDPAKRADLAGSAVSLIYDTFAVLPIATTDMIWGKGPRIASWSPTNGSIAAVNFETLRP